MQNTSNDQWEVERIIDKRKNEKGKTEYLVRWKDYGSEEDTWEPVLHLKNCKDFTRAFNRHHTKKKRVSKLTRRCRASSKKSQKNISRSTKTILSLTSPKLIEIGKTPEHQKDPLFGSSQNVKRNSTSSLTGQKTMEDKKTLVPCSPMKCEMVENDIQKESLQELRDPTEQCLDDRSVPLVAADKRLGALVGLRMEKLRMDDGLKIASLDSVVPGPVSAAMVIDLTTSRKCKSPFPSELDANGTTRMQTPVMGVRAGKRKVLHERTQQPSDKHLRFSLRQIESTSRYKDIVVRKRDGFTHILLSTKSSKDNSLNPEVMKEVQSALNMAAATDSKIVLLSAVGSMFCCGLDFAYFLRCLTKNRKRESVKMAEAVKTFVNTFIQFKKPIIVAVNGPAIGLGASILPLCDVVWASDKAWFQTPYTTFGQSPDGCSSVTFPKIMGRASASEMLLSGRKLTAQEACEKGLVSQTFWPETFNQEVMFRIQAMSSGDPVVLEESKTLMHCHMQHELEKANERECEVLKKIWSSAQGMDYMLKYLEKKTNDF